MNMNKVINSNNMNNMNNFRNSNNSENISNMNNNHTQLYWKIGTNYLPLEYETMQLQFSYCLLQDQRLDVVEWEVYQVRY